MAADPLAQLNDIITSPVPAYWPLSWWATILLAVVPLVAVSLAILLRRRHRHRRPLKLALHSLDRLPTTVDASELSALLKRCALVYYPREEVASLSGRSWDLWLANYQNRDQQLLWETLSAKRYSADNRVEKAEYQPMLKQTLRKLATGRVPC